MTILQVGRQLFGAEYFDRYNASVRLHSQASGIPEGHSDYAGLAQNGTAVYVEGKSLAKPKPRPKQERFLDNREKRGAFCCVAFDEVPGQVARAYDAFRFDRLDGDGKIILYAWRANYEANLAEAKRAAKARNASPVTNRHAREGLKSALSDAVDRMAKGRRRVTP